MSTAQGNCPRCGTRSVAFRLLGQHRWHGDEDSEDRFFDVFGECGHCNRGVILTYKIGYGEADPLQQGMHQFLSSDGLLEIAPEPASTGAPQHTPNRVADLFRQGRESLNSGSWDAAGAMFRKAVEIGLKVRFPDINPEWRPDKRIKKAADDHLLTSDLAEWAHRIRYMGNEAVHEDVFTEAQAREMSAFTEIMLQYMFTLPGKLSAARDAVEKREAPAS